MRRLLPLLALAVLPACASGPQTNMAAPAVRPTSTATAPADGGWVQDQLFFGMRRGADTIPTAQWDAFLAEVVTPRFPQGLTVWTARGQWREDDGTITREPARVLLLVHRPTAADERSIEEIRAEWRRRFGQQSVLRVRGRVEASF